MSDATAPTVAIVVPCHDEAGYVDVMLDGLIPQLERAPSWSLVLVDDSSTDATPELLQAAALRCDRTTVLSGRFGSPGAARSAGVAQAFRSVDPTWLVTLDADVVVPSEWLDRWAAAFTDVADDDAVGALNGLEGQHHLFVDHPLAAKVSAAFGHTVGVSERAVGVTNLNGVNHAIRADAYRCAGPYLQPVAPGPFGPETLAGEDWDLGVRIRRAGFDVRESTAEVLDRGRRLLTDVHAYVSGEAYEGAFRRLTGDGASPDIDAADVRSLADGAIARSLRHFFFKPVLAEAIALDAIDGISDHLRDQFAAWMRRWPHPTFEESRNGFVFGRLERFSDAFVDQVRDELGLTVDAVLSLTP